jgi:hypothetical protein
MEFLSFAREDPTPARYASGLIQLKFNLDTALCQGALSCSKMPMYTGVQPTREDKVKFKDGRPIVVTH